MKIRVFFLTNYVNVNIIFLEKLISAYASAMNEYIISYEKIKKARN